MSEKKVLLKKVFFQKKNVLLKKVFFRKFVGAGHRSGTEAGRWSGAEVPRANFRKQNLFWARLFFLKQNTFWARLFSHKNDFADKKIELPYMNNNFYEFFQQKKKLFEHRIQLSGQVLLSSLIYDARLYTDEFSIRQTTQFHRLKHFAKSAWKNQHTSVFLGKKCFAHNIQSTFLVLVPDWLETDFWWILISAIT